MLRAPDHLLPAILPRRATNSRRWYHQCEYQNIGGCWHCMEPGSEVTEDGQRNGGGKAGERLAQVSGRHQKTRWWKPCPLAAFRGFPSSQPSTGQGGLCWRRLV